MNLFNGIGKVYSGSGYSPLLEGTMMYSKAKSLPEGSLKNAYNTLGSANMMMFDAYSGLDALFSVLGSVHEGSESVYDSLKNSSKFKGIASLLP